MIQSPYESVPLRIGVMPTTWASPLANELTNMHPITVVKETPDAMIHMLENETLDCALLPPWAAGSLKHGRAIPGLGVCTSGPAPCQQLLLPCAPQQVAQIAVPPGWASAAKLSALILALQYRLHVPIVETSLQDFIQQAYVQFELTEADQENPAYTLMDVCAEWTAQTGLPYPHAVWIGRHGAPLPKLRAVLARTHQLSVAALESKSSAHPAHMGVTYYMGGAAMEGLRRAFELGTEYGLCGPDTEFVFC